MLAAEGFKALRIAQLWAAGGITSIDSSVDRARFQLYQANLPSLVSLEPKCMTRHFPRLKLRSHCFDQSDSRSKSACKALWFSLELREHITLTSSAYLSMVACIKHLSISSIYKTKRRGPKTEPWGTPLRTGDQAEEAPWTTTLCWRSHKNLSIQASREPWIPKEFNLWSSRRWGTVSNALEKSIKTALQPLRSSRLLVKISWNCRRDVRQD